MKVAVPRRSWLDRFLPLLFLALLGSVEGGRAAGKVVAWGDNSYGQTNVPPDLTNVVAVTAGDIYTLALKSDGTVAAWGNNSSGQTDVPPDLTNVVAVAAGAAHALALKSDGTVVGWGADDFGQATVPASLALSSVRAIAAGRLHSLAIMENGVVAAWGDNRYGQGSLFPDVPRMCCEGAIAIAAGDFHNLVLKEDGTILAWGAGAPTMGEPPVNSGQAIVPPGLSNAVAISAGDLHSLALRRDGTVTAWGLNSEHQTSVPPGLSNVVAVAGAGRHSLALMESGTPVAWGYPFFGSVPSVGGFSNVVAIDAGLVHGVAIVADGSPMVTVQPAGRNVFTGGEAVIQVMAAGCGPLNYQWHRNGLDLPGATNSFLRLSEIQLGDGGSYTVTVSNSTGQTESKPAVLAPIVSPPLIRVQPTNQQVCLGSAATFRVAAEGSLPLGYQWRRDGNDIAGANSAVLDLQRLRRNQDGIYSVVVSNVAGTVPSENVILLLTPVAAWGASLYGLTNVPWGLTNAVAVAAGGGHNLALRSDGTVVVWGADWGGQTNVPSGLTGVKAIAARGTFSLVLTSNGQVVSWGGDFYGQGNIPYDLSDVAEIAAGGHHSLALRSDGRVVAWGSPYYDYGQAKVPTGLSNVVAIAAGDMHSLALTDGGTVVAWGDGRSGQTNVPSGLNKVVAVAAGWEHSLALREDGTVVGWGSDNHGQSTVPPGVTNVLAVAAGASQSLALTSDGRVIQWGAATDSAAPEITDAIAIAAGGSCLAIIGDGTPAITVQPANRRMLTGKPVTLQVMAAGQQPLHYQWRFEGTDIPDGTNSILVLPAVGIPDGGRYTVVVSNQIGATISRPAVLSPRTSPPWFVSQPANQRVPRLGTATFNAIVDGSGPLHYQWSFRDVAISGATNAALVIAGADFSNAGPYTVAIRNSYGAITSAPALLCLSFDYEFAAPEGPQLWDFSGVYPSPLKTLQQNPDGFLSNNTGASGRVWGNGSAVGLDLTTPGPSGYWFSFSSTHIEYILENRCTATLALDPTQRVLVGNNSCVTIGQEYVLFLFTWAPYRNLTIDNYSTPISLPLPDGVDGRWRLALEVASNDRLISGRAIITLAGGNIIAFELNGTNSQVTKSVMHLQSSSSHLTVVTTGPEMSLQSVHGNVAGQSVDYDAPVRKTPLTLTINGSGSLAPLKSGQALVLGKDYTLKAVPRPGNLFSNWLVAGNAVNNPTLRFTMSSNLVIAANFVPNPFLELKGSHTGLYYDTNELTHANAGFFSLAVKDSGAFSGRLQQGAAKYPFSGSFDLALSAARSVARHRTNEVVVRLQLAADSDRIFGSVSNAAWSSELFGYRAAFNRRANPATNFQGAFTMLLAGAVEPEDGPPGHGFARVTVSSAGNLSFKGTLGDGSPAVQKVPLAANGQWPLYAGLYSGKGSVFGWLTLINTPANDVIGPVLWTKPGGFNGPLHPAGFTNEVETLGSRYVVPASGTRVGNFSNAVVVLEGGNLSSALTNTIVLTDRNKVTVDAPNPQKLSLALAMSSGSFKGSFVHPQTGRSAALKGVLLQKQNLGAGFFLGTNQSGRVFFGEMERDLEEPTFP